MDALVVSGFPLVRHGLRTLLEGSGLMANIAEASQRTEVLEAAQRLKFDIILLDQSLMMPSVIEIVERVRMRIRQTKMLVLCDRLDIYEVKCLLKAGASGVLMFNASMDEIAFSVRQLMCGARYLSPVFSDALACSALGQDDRLPHSLLSRREYQTLLLLGAGVRVTDIAKGMSLSVKTVSSYRSRILEKMNLRNNSEITLYLARNGFRI
ncbi:response regulator transcription factor [Burkholderia ubonensis]|uniref:LuxR C-terminal-related transcriptional regulator n=1 Tax=Burkholderia ubonensis TaxID=101571 RepID=UPI0009B415EF|nr:response regulator transcription factor [Burkholderia ubonensis]